MIYTYICNNNKCTHYHKKFDIKQKMSDEKLTICKHCNQSTLTKVPNTTSFKLSGIGVYKNKTY